MPVTFTYGTQFEVDANGGLARVATLTSSTAIALYSSAASGIEARHLTNNSGILTGGAVLTIDANQADSITICRLSDTTALVGYAYGATHRVRVLSVSGTTLTAETATNMTDTGVDFLSCALLDTNKVIYIYSSSGSDGKARILTLSGITITENAVYTFVATGDVLATTVGIIDTATAMIGWIKSGSGAPAEVLDISGTTITGNTSLGIVASTGTTSTDNSTIDVSMSLSDSNWGYFVFRNNADAILHAALSNSGGTLTREYSLTWASPEAFNMCTIAVYKHVDGADPGYDYFIAASNDTDNDRFEITEYDPWFGGLESDTSISTTNAVTAEGQLRLFPGTTTGILVWNGSTEAITITAPGPALSLASMTKPASINADGTFIYLSLLQGGTPILTKIATDLLSDGSTVFNPGSGDNIGVQCGKFNSDVVWVAGNFGGTDTVEKSEDGGASFSVKDPATFDPVTSFVVGPDSDDRVLAFTDAGGSVASSSIQETIDSGAAWSQKDSALGFVSKAVERLDINPEEIVTGNEAGASDNIHYSPNTGQDLEDYSTGFPTQDVTKLIVS